MTELNSILSSIGIGAVTASIVTFWGNRYLSQISYNREGNKFLVQKRIVAYDEIEKIIIALDERIIIKSESGDILYTGYKILVKSENVCYSKFVLELFSKYSYYKLWLSKEMEDCLRDVFIELDKIYQALENEQGSNCILNNVLAENRIKVLSKQSIEIYYRDAINIKRIDSFIKDKVS